MSFIDPDDIFYFHRKKRGCPRMSMKMISTLPAFWMIPTFVSLSLRDWEIWQRKKWKRHISSHVIVWTRRGCFQPCMRLMARALLEISTSHSSLPSLPFAHHMFTIALLFLLSSLSVAFFISFLAPTIPMHCGLYSPHFRLSRGESWCRSGVIWQGEFQG